MREWRGLTTDDFDYRTWTEEMSLKVIQRFVFRYSIKLGDKYRPKLELAICETPEDELQGMEDPKKFLDEKKNAMADYLFSLLSIKYRSKQYKNYFFSKMEEGRYIFDKVKHEFRETPQRAGFDMNIPRLDKHV